MKRTIKWLLLGVVGLFVLVLIFGSGKSEKDIDNDGLNQEVVVEEVQSVGVDDAKDVVVEALPGNKTQIEIKAEDLVVVDNPKGEGKVVYVSETRFNGVERFLLWVVIDGKAYPVNGASKDVTPDLSWPREAEDLVWDRTGLDKYEATELIDLIFD